MDARAYTQVSSFSIRFQNQDLTTANKCRVDMKHDALFFSNYLPI